MQLKLAVKLLLQQLSQTDHFSLITAMADKVGAGVTGGAQQEGEELPGIFLPQMRDTVAGVFSGKVANSQLSGGGMNVVDEEGQDTLAIAINGKSLGINMGVV